MDKKHLTTLNYRISILKEFLQPSIQKSIKVPEFLKPTYEIVCKILGTSVIYSPIGTWILHQIIMYSNKEKQSPPFQLDKWTNQ